MAVRVLIAEDEWLVAAGLRSQLNRLGCEVVGVVRTGAEAVRACVEARPDVVFMDVQMPEMDGLTATRRLMETSPQAVIIVTGNSTLRAAAEEAGAMGFVVKPLLDSQIPALIEEAARRFARYRAVRDQAAAGGPAAQDWRTARLALQHLITLDGHTEAGGFDLLQRRAADAGHSLREAAEEVLAEVEADARGAA
jgi:AmiR/NasT family two-component response regulator